MDLSATSNEMLILSGISDKESVLASWPFSLLSAFPRILLWDIDTVTKGGGA